MSNIIFISYKDHCHQKKMCGPILHVYMMRVISQALVERKLETKFANREQLMGTF